MVLLRRLGEMASSTFLSSANELAVEGIGIDAQGESDRLLHSVFLQASELRERKVCTHRNFRASPEAPA
jgi:hypothetical protein